MDTHILLTISSGHLEVLSKIAGMMIPIVVSAWKDVRSQISHLKVENACSYSPKDSTTAFAKMIKPKTYHVIIMYKYFYNDICACNYKIDNTVLLTRGFYECHDL